MDVTVEEFDGGWLVRHGETETRFYHNAPEACGFTAEERARQHEQTCLAALEGWKSGRCVTMRIAA